MYYEDESSWCDCCENPRVCCTCPQYQTLPEGGDDIEDIVDGNPIDMKEVCGGDV